MTDWAPDRLHPLRVQLRDRGPARRPQARPHPRRQGPPRLAGLHLQQGDAARPLPERPAPPDLPAAAHGPTAATRRSTGTPRSPRSPRASSGSRDEHGGESIFYYGGGGQGNHLGGAYSGAFLRALGSRYRSSALAQEKTGEGWVEHSLYGSHTRGEFEHAEVSVFVGKNPWMSQSFPRARVVLREIAKDPERSMIVIDPVITDTAKLADFHLRVRPGTDAWCLAAMVGVLVQEDLVDHEFLAEHVSGAEAVLARFGRGRRQPTTPRYCGVDEALIRAAARRIADARPACPCSRTSASSRRRTARSAPTSTGCCGS